MTATHVRTAKKAHVFVEEDAEGRAKRELLIFWGMHPNAKFDKSAISYALGCTRTEIERALVGLLETGLVDQCVSNGVTLYSLTRNEEKRHPILTYATHGHDWW